MPIGRISGSRRGVLAVAAAAAFAISSGWTAYVSSLSGTPEQVIHQAIERGYVPPAVRLAVDKLIKPWEGLRLTAYQDSVKVWTICWGETKGVKAGMRATPEECDAMLIKRVIHDYYLPLVDNVKDFAKAPDSVQASMISGAYNFGVGSKKPRRGQIGSRTSEFVSAHQYRNACEAQTAWNKAGGDVLPGLVKRREMGDAQRLGEAELCVSGLSR
ncbi:lysozyme [Mesorhizobium sp.]|uniref:lysozyme n=1 Tax=Mesorhizobium sp. TaxID=1871066 RepID=UPI000FE46D14|nr:lysozyme [Mesorhizobium sp.]RWE37475.1 MAG: glycoside hydrolase [Mesorhizobium sp.]